MRKATNKAYEITDAKISFVSLVDKAANLRKFLITKQEDGKASFTTCGRIVKTDAENHYVTGVVYEPLTEDSQGNYMTEAEIIKACYWYSENGDKVDLQHSFEPLSNATVVENWVAKADFKIGDEEVKKGTWLMTVKVANPDIWKGIENGEITGFSMGGIGNYSEENVDLDSVSKGQDTSEKKSLLKRLGEALGINVVEKGAMAELYEVRSRSSLFWNALDTLQEILYSYDSVTGCWKYENDESRVREALEDFNRIITEILTGKESITKAIQADRPIKKDGMSDKNKENLNDTKEEKEVTKQEVEQIVSAAISKALGGNAQQEGAETVEKEQGNNTPAEAEITSETIEKMVNTAIEKALTPQAEPVTAEQVQEMITSAVEKAIDPVLKSRGLPTNLNGNSEVKKTADDEHYLHGIL